MYLKPVIQNDKTGLLHTHQQKRPELFSQKALQLWSFALTLTVLMKRIKQEQHIEIQEKSQQLKFRMQTEIQIDKHHALC